jgi:starch synthase
VNVALLTREYPPEVYGGAGVHVEYLARELAQLVEVRVREARRRVGVAPDRGPHVLEALAGVERLPAALGIDAHGEHPGHAGLAGGADQLLVAALRERQVGVGVDHYDSCLGNSGGRRSTVRTVPPAGVAPA